MTKRIEGYDLARALAVFGMVFVNFKIVMGSSDGSANLRALISLMEGRASALFVVLAGVGLSLMAAGTRQFALLQRVMPILQRGVLLLVTGLVLATVWPADILHFYGCYFIFAAFFVGARDGLLWLSAAMASLISLLMLLFCDYELGWNFENLSYLDFWTPEGMARHIFFNGFHPVFPWITFVFVGMWLGRQDLHNARVRFNLFRVSCMVWCVTELVSKAATQLLGDADLIALMDTEAMPPTPFYCIAASSLAIAIICASVSLLNHIPHSFFIRALISTGRLSLTIYVAHIFIGMGVLEALGFLGQQSIEVAVMSALVFCIAAMAFCVVWLKYFTCGPLEYLFRKLASGAPTAQGDQGKRR